ncbi:MAG: hypothetical protein JWP91_2607 [Fibrobacteres bacterium]|nr:hypothetical protein [Fibrobacterota bacterium]
MIPTKSPVNLRTRLEPKDLPDSGKGWCLSLYLPFHKNFRESLEDGIQLKDLHRTARLALEERGVPPEDMQALLAPVQDLMELKDPSLFRGEGLAVLATVSSSVTVLLSKAPPALAEVDMRFRLDYLLPTLFRMDRFHLLCLSLKSVHLWDCDGIDMREVLLPDVETNIRSTPHFEESGSDSFHANSGTAGRSGSKGQGSSFFGQGSGENDAKAMKKEAEHFFRTIDAAVLPFLKAGHVPLILAGVEYLLPIYRGINSYSGLSPHQITGSPDAPGAAADLHGKANAILRDEDGEARRQALDTYRENVATKRTSAGYTDIVPTACFKNLTHLFVKEGSLKWGTYDHATGKTEMTAGYLPGAENLANLACAGTLDGHGKVYLVPGEEMPAETEIAGLCRD